MFVWAKQAAEELLFAAMRRMVVVFVFLVLVVYAGVAAQMLRRRYYCCSSRIYALLFLIRVDKCDRIALFLLNFQKPIGEGAQRDGSGYNVHINLDLFLSKV